MVMPFASTSSFPLFLSLLTFLFLLPDGSYADVIPRKVLFLTNADRGQANVQIATARALLADHVADGNFEIHFCSFAEFGPVLSAGLPDAGVTFHPIAGTAFLPAFERVNISQSEIRSPPGWRGIDIVTKVINYMVPWRNEEYVAIYNDIVEVVRQLQPALVVVDCIMTPGLDAAVAVVGKKKVMELCPSQIQSVGLPGVGLWKILTEYPSLASGIPYPVPLLRIPENVYMVLRTVYTVFTSPRRSSLVAYLGSLNITHQSMGASVCPPSMPCLLASSPLLEAPIAVPDHARTCGAVLQDSEYISKPAAALAALESIDPDLAAWLVGRPHTVLINLGSHTRFSEADAEAMLDGIEEFLASTSPASTQVLWKMAADDDMAALGTQTALRKRIAAVSATSRLRVVSWLLPSPSLLLQTGQVKVWVNHGGLNSFSEGIASGVPQVVLAMWFDCYDAAVRVERLGVGVWGNEGVAPWWKGKQIAQALARVLDEKEGYGERAVRLRDAVREREGGNGAEVCAREVRAALEGEWVVGTQEEEKATHDRTEL